MPLSETQLFDLLIQKVENIFRNRYPEVQTPIAEWKGNNIDLFREDLQHHAGGSVSEKWFYTHIKGSHERLPRIDTLDLLSVYVGSKNWNEFLHQNRLSEEDKRVLNKDSNKRTHKIPLFYTLGTLALIAVVIGFIFIDTSKSFNICFVDQNTLIPVNDPKLEITLSNGNESPKLIPLQNGCYIGNGERVEFTVKGQYYKPKHVKRAIAEDEYKEVIKLEPDDYAMMIYMFSNSKVEDWRRRRQKLSEFIHAEARIYQMSKDGFCMDVFNKSEFINKLSLPTRSLKNIEIISTDYKNDQIYQLRFIQH